MRMLTKSKVALLVLLLSVGHDERVIGFVHPVGYSGVVVKRSSYDGPMTIPVQQRGPSCRGFLICNAKKGKKEKKDKEDKVVELKEDEKEKKLFPRGAFESIKNGIISLGVGIVSFVVGVFVAVGLVLTFPDWRSQPVTLFQIILNDLDRYYVDEIDSNRLLETSVSAMLRSLDSYSEYQDSLNELSTNMNNNVNNKYGNVGISISGITQKELETYNNEAQALETLLKKNAKNKLLSTTETSTTTTNAKLLPQEALDDGDSSSEDEDLLASRIDRQNELERLRQRGIRVASTMEGPAFDAGIRVGDKLLSVNHLQITADTPREDVVKALQGRPGTPAEVSYLREGNVPRKATLVRSLLAIRLSTILENTSTAYICLNDLPIDAGRQVRNAIMALQQQTPLTGIILDLRNNNAGELSAAVDVASLFVPRGSEIVTTKGKSVPPKIYRSIQDPIIDSQTTKIVALVNQKTSSAAEVVAAAIQDLDVGLIVGKDRTMGKGVVQQSVSLPYHAEITYTTAKFYSPSGRGIQQQQQQPFQQQDGLFFADSPLRQKLKDRDRAILYTKAGRAIRDGGGVEVDVKVAPRKLSNLEYTLKRSNVFQDFATEWIKNHKQNDKKMVVTPEMYKSFQNFVAERQKRGDVRLEGAYKGTLSVLRNTLRAGGYQDSAGRGLDALQSTILKEAQGDFQSFAPYIKEDIAQAILARSIPESQVLERTLKIDKEVQAAQSLLQDSSQFDSILARGSTSTTTNSGMVAAVK